MARKARIVIPDIPHHISQRGVNGGHIFFKKDHFILYLDILREQVQRHKIAILNYCLLPNQIHFIAKPAKKTSLGRAIGETNRQYSQKLTIEGHEKGALFQNRFFSYAMDEQIALKSAVFIETLPVMARIAKTPDQYLWSSARYRLRNNDSPLLTPMPSFHAMNNWDKYLARPLSIADMDLIKTHLQTGRPMGSDIFIASVEAKLGYSVRPQKRGRKPASENVKKAA